MIQLKKQLELIEVRGLQKANCLTLVDMKFIMEVKIVFLVNTMNIMPLQIQLL